MTAKGTSRRDFLAAAAIGAAVGTAATGEATEPTVTDPLQRARKYGLRPATRDRIKAGHEAVLAELKPTRAQRERGLALRSSTMPSAR